MSVLPATASASADGQVRLDEVRSQETVHTYIYTYIYDTVSKILFASSISML